MDPVLGWLILPAVFALLWLHGQRCDYYGWRPLDDDNAP